MPTSDRPPRRLAALTVASAVAAASLSAVALTAPAASAADPTFGTFCSYTPISIPERGNASPFPSTLAIGPFSGPVSKVDLTLLGVSHTFWADLVIDLASPGGASVRVRDVDGGSADAPNATYLFEDGGPAFVPQGAVVPGGTYAPKNSFAPLAGGAGAGTWSLSVHDQFIGDSGSIAGFCVSLNVYSTTTSATVSPASAPFGTPVTVTPSVTGARTPTTGNLTYSLDGGAFEPVPGGGGPSAPFELDDVAVGNHQVRVRYDDPTGEFRSSTSAPQTFTITKVPQAVAFTDPVTTGVPGRSESFTATGGASSQPVVIGSSTPTVCTVDDPVSADASTTATVSYLAEGTCTLTADQAGDTTYAAAPQVTTNVTVDKLAQVVSFTSAPSAVEAKSTGTVTATGGDSGQPVVIASNTPSVCTVTDSTSSRRGGTTATIRYLVNGACILTADQAGDVSYDAAQQASTSIDVARYPTRLVVSPSVARSVVGQPVRPVATVSSSNGNAPGSVQFTVDGVAVGDPVPVSGRTATGPELDLAPGSYRLGAAYAPSDDDYGRSSGTSTLVVEKASTTTSLTVGPESLTARVDVTPPGAGVPTGAVRFAVDGETVGEAPVDSDGTAVLPYAGDGTDAVASYLGDSDFAASTSRASRSTPTIVGTTGRAANRFGWFNRAVAVRFTCTADGSPVTSCTPPVRVRRDGRQAIEGTVAAADGGTSVTTVAVNLDRVRPTVRAAGVRDGATYSKVRQVRCVGRDRLSGIADCQVTTTRSGKKVDYRVVAIDRAGNRSRAVRGSYRLR